jgi:flagellar biosynthesis protein FliR
MVTQQWLFSQFLVFCRVGGCFLLLPGLSSERIPPQARLFLSLAVSIAVCPLVLTDIAPEIVSSAASLLAAILTESALGLFLGFMVRIFFLALEFASVAAANFIGYGSAFAHAIETGEQAPALSTLVTLSATVLFFVFDQHLRMISVLIGSYATIPPAHALDGANALSTLVAAFAAAFKMSLHVSAPLLAFSLTVNWFLGLVNKMVPQIPVYFISTPILLFGGLFILYVALGDILMSFGANIAAHISGLLSSG